MPNFGRAILLLILSSPVLLAAPTDRYEELTGEEDDFQVVEKPWKEYRGAIPPLPAAGDWTPVRLDALPRNQHAFIDLESLTVGKRDQVIRYWLSIRSDGGAAMTTYEGVHCGNKQFIVYAYGYPGRQPPVRAARSPRWRELFSRRAVTYRKELARDVLCSGETARTPRQIGQAARGRYEQLNPFDNWTNDD